MGSPRRVVKDSKTPERFCNSMALVSNINEFEPSNFEETTNQQVWRDAMVEEYDSVMKNDVWEVVPRLKGKLMVTSLWLYKIKYVADGNIEKYKAWYVAE